MSREIHRLKEPVAAPIDWLSYKPTWRISLLELVDPFGWQRVDASTLETIRTKLQHFETMTLSEIFMAGAKRNHGVAVERLCSEAKRRLRQIGHDDVEHLYTLRLSGPERIWGIRECNVFSLLWWDPKHQVCPSLK